LLSNLKLQRVRLVTVQTTIAAVRTVQLQLAYRNIDENHGKV